MDIYVVINTMIVLLILIAVGFVIRKSHFGDLSMQETVAKLILNVTAPTMMLSSVTGGGVNGSLRDVIIVFIIALVMYGFLPILGFVLGKLYKAQGKDLNLFIFMTTFSNVGFMGFPVIRSIYGENGVFYTAIFNMIFNILSYSYGMALMSGKPISRRIRDYINPGTIAAVLTITLYFLKVPFHPAINLATRYLGDATTPLAMLVIGMSLSAIPLKSLFSDFKILTFMLIKQIIIPLIALFILKPIITDPLILGVTIIIIAMPVATNCVLFATKFRNNVEAATRAVFISTITSLITIPVLTMFLHK